MVSQFEREAIGERKRDAMVHLRESGSYTGNAPFGGKVSTDGWHVEPNADEMRTLQTIRRWRAGGNRFGGLRPISTGVASEPVPAPNGARSA